MIFLNYKEFDEQLQRITKQHFICMKESKNFSTNPYKESLKSIKWNRIKMAEKNWKNSLQQIHLEPTKRQCRVADLTILL